MDDARGSLGGQGNQKAVRYLPTLSDGKQVVEDYMSLRLSLRAHPLALLRPLLTPPEAWPDVS